MGEWLPTVQEALDAFIADLELAGRSPATRVGYYRTLKPLRTLSFGIRDLDEPACRQLVVEHVRSHALSSSASFYATFASFVAFCVERGWLVSSPLKGVTKPRVKEKPPHRYLTAEQLRACWDHALNDETRLILLLLMTGLRASELCGLRWKDVDWERQRVSLIGKGSKPRIIAVPPLAMKLLEARINSDDRLSFSDGTIIASGTTALRLRITRLGRRAGIPGLHPHRFRHTFAVQWLLAGGEQGTLMSLGGWSKAETMRWYARSALEETALERAREINLAEKLFGE